MKKFSEGKCVINFGKSLRRRKIFRDFTQKIIRRKIGISGEWVSKIKCGESSPDCYNLLLFVIAIEFKTINEIYSVLKEVAADVPLYTY